MENLLEINNQEYVSKILNSQLSGNKISHAYLFTGPAGAGKFQCAMELSKILLGISMSNSIDKIIHPDFRIYSPDGVHGYLVGQIKEIVKSSNLEPIQAKKKVYIVKNAEKLGVSAANAFLKTLEEPSVNSCYILIANDDKNVLSTIVSRCQVLHFKAIPYDMALNYVKKESGADINDAKYALDLYGCNTEKAVEYCIDQNLQDFTSEVNNTISNINDLTDWDIILRSKDIVTKFNEVVDAYKYYLIEQTKEQEEVLEHAAMQIIEEQNKRSVNSKQKELLYLFIACIKKLYRDKLSNNIDNTDVSDTINTLNLLSEFEHKLAYNITAQNFCDVVLLQLKNNNIQ